MTGAAALPAARTRNVFGAVLLASSWIFFTAEMVATRILAEDLSVAQIAAVRMATQAILFLPAIILTAGALLATQRLPMHFVRAFLSAAGMITFYIAFATLPLATATTLTFTVAMWLTIFAVLFLGERVGIRRTTAVVVGFLGVLIVMRPGFVAIEPGMLAALGGAVFAALLMIVTRSLSATDGRFTIMAYSAWLGLAYLAIPAALTWQPIVTTEQWLLLAVVGISGTIGQFLMVGAFQMAEASALAPVDYVRLVFALIAGYLVFAEVPDVWTWTGAAVIIASTAYTTYRERKVGARRRGMEDDPDGTPA